MKLKELAIALFATFALLHSSYAADTPATEKKAAPAKTQKAKAPEPTATPGVHKIEKKPKEDKPAEAGAEKPAKPKVKRPEELKAEKDAKK